MTENSHSRNDALPTLGTVPLGAPITTEAVLDILAARGQVRDDVLVHQVVSAAERMQRVIAQLRSAGDCILAQVAQTPALPASEQLDAEQVLTRVVEHIETMMLVRQSVATLVLPPDDDEVVALISRSEAIAAAVLAAAA